jgi:hypothetical protein
MREEHRFRVFEKRVLGSVLGLRGRNGQEDGEYSMIRSLIICTPHQIAQYQHNQILKDEMRVLLERPVEIENARKILVGKI